MTSRSFQTATHTPSAHTGGHTTRTGGATGGAAAATATHTAGFTSAADDDLFGFLDADTVERQSKWVVHNALFVSASEVAPRSPGSHRRPTPLPHSHSR